MSTLAPNYKDATDTGSRPSPSIWGNCPILAGVENKAVGTLFFDDGFGRLPANTANAQCGDYNAYAGATSGSYIYDAGLDGGVMTLETTTDDEGAAVRSAAAFTIAAGKGRFWFECRVKTLNITDSKYNVLIGLIEAGVPSITFGVTSSDALSDNNLVGFQRIFADGDQYDTTYKANTVTAVVVKADAVTVVADTFIKLGMYFDGSYLYFYKDGARLADSKAITGTAGTDFPSDVSMGVIAAIAAGHGDACSISIDWIQAFQEHV